MKVDLDKILSLAIDKAQKIIDNDFDFLKIKKSFYTKENCSKILEILFYYAYDIEKMRNKFDNYVKNITENPNTDLSYIFIIPFKVERKKGYPSYEQEKYYENGSRMYRGYITHYEFPPLITNKIDEYKLKKYVEIIHKLFDLRSGKITIKDTYFEYRNCYSIADFFEYTKYKILADHCMIINHSEKLREDDKYDYEFE